MKIKIYSVVFERMGLTEDVRLFTSLESAREEAKDWEGAGGGNSTTIHEHNFPFSHRKIV
jgi:hypothetical protein